MQGHEHHQTQTLFGATSQGSPLPEEYPVREYVGAMAVELAQMARFNGDEALASLLEAAAALSKQPATADMDAGAPLGDLPS